MKKTRISSKEIKEKRINIKIKKSLSYVESTQNMEGIYFSRWELNKYKRNIKLNLYNENRRG